MKKIFAIMVVAMATVVCSTINAQEKKVSWVEVQQVDIPVGQNIHEGVTKNGNPKYWFEFPNIGKVTVSPGSAVKYIKGEVMLILVKWENIDNGNIKYSVRQKEKSVKKTPNVDLNSIF